MEAGFDSSTLKKGRPTPPLKILPNVTAAANGEEQRERRNREKLQKEESTVSSVEEKLATKYLGIEKNTWSLFVERCSRYFYYSKSRHYEFHRSLKEAIRAANIKMRLAKHNKNVCFSSFDKWDRLKPLPEPVEDEEEESGGTPAFMRIVVERVPSPNSTATSRFKVLNFSWTEYRNLMVCLFHIKSCSNWRTSCSRIGEQAPPSLCLSMHRHLPKSLIRSLFPGADPLSLYCSESCKALLPIHEDCGKEWGFGCDGCSRVDPPKGPLRESVVNPWLEPYSGALAIDPMTLDDDPRGELMDVEDREGSIDLALRSFSANKSVTVMDIYRREAVPWVIALAHPYDLSLLVFSVCHGLRPEGDPLPLYLKVKRRIISRTGERTEDAETDEALDRVIELSSSTTVDDRYARQIWDLRKLTPRTSARHRMIPFRLVEGGAAMEFGRDRASPLDIFCSMRYLSSLYPTVFGDWKPEGEGELNLRWADSVVLLTLSTEQRRRLSEVLCMYIQRTSQSVGSAGTSRWSCVYPMIVSKFLYGDALEASLASKMILKSFKKTKTLARSGSTSGRLLLRGNEPWFREYLDLLPKVVLNAYRDKGFLWYGLVQPYRDVYARNFGWSDKLKRRVATNRRLFEKLHRRLDNDYRISRWSSVKGFRPSYGSIYRGLEAFFYVYARHGIRGSAVKAFANYVLLLDGEEDLAWIYEDHEAIQILLLGMYNVQGGEAIEDEDILDLPDSLQDGGPTEEEILAIAMISKKRPRGRPKKRRDPMEQSGRARKRKRTGSYLESLVAEEEVREEAPKGRKSTLRHLYSLCSDRRLPEYLAYMLFESTFAALDEEGRSQFHKELRLSGGYRGRLEDMALSKLAVIPALEKLGLPVVDLKDEEIELEEGEVFVPPPQDQLPVDDEDLDLLLEEAAAQQETFQDFTNECEAFLYLVEYLERLSFFGVHLCEGDTDSEAPYYRGYQRQVPKDYERFLPLDNQKVAQNPELYLRTVQVPLYFDEDHLPVFASQCMPLWNSEIAEVNLPPKIPHSLSSNSPAAAVTSNDGKVSDKMVQPNLFSDCHKDLLNALILFPCTAVTEPPKIERSE